MKLLMLLLHQQNIHMVYINYNIIQIRLYDINKREIIYFPVNSKSDYVNFQTRPQMSDGNMVYEDYNPTDKIARVWLYSLSENSFQPLLYAEKSKNCFYPRASYYSVSAIGLVGWLETNHTVVFNDDYRGCIFEDSVDLTTDFKLVIMTLPNRAVTSILPSDWKENNYEIVFITYFLVI